MFLEEPLTSTIFINNSISIRTYSLTLAKNNHHILANYQKSVCQKTLIEIKILPRKHSLALTQKNIVASVDKKIGFPKDHSLILQILPTTK